MDVPVSRVPSSWETLYPAPYPSYPYRFHVGDSVQQHVRINLQTGSVQALTDAPTSRYSGWFAGYSPSWSNDGQAILLPGTFLNSIAHAPYRPCVDVLDLTSNTG